MELEGYGGILKYVNYDSKCFNYPTTAREMSTARTKTASASFHQRSSPGRLENLPKRSSTVGVNSGVRVRTNQTAGGSGTSVLAKPSAKLNAKTINPVRL